MAAEAGAGPTDFVIPDTLPVLPLRDAVVLPLTAVPLTVGRPRSVQLVDDVMRGNRLLALVAERDVNERPRPRGPAPRRDGGRDPPASPGAGRHRPPDGPGHRADPPGGLHRDGPISGRAGRGSEGPDRPGDGGGRPPPRGGRRVPTPRGSLGGDARRDGDGRRESLRSPPRGLLRRGGGADRRGGPPGAARARPRVGQAPSPDRPVAARACGAGAGTEDHHRDRGAAHQEAAGILSARAAPVHPEGAGGRAGAAAAKARSSGAASRRRGCPTRRGARRSASSPGSRDSRRHRRSTA